MLFFYVYSIRSSQFQLQVLLLSCRMALSATRQSQLLHGDNVRLGGHRSGHRSGSTDRICGSTRASYGCSA